MYGTALETWPPRPLTSSGYDVWVKRTRDLIVNPMYGTMNFFNTDGPAQDDYRVGKSRGDGGLGVWQDRNCMSPKTGALAKSSPPARSARNLN